MAKRNQYNRPNMGFSQLSSIAFDGRVRLASVMSLSVSGTLAAQVASASTNPVVIGNGSIVAVTQSAQSGLLSFNDVTLAQSESFSVVLVNTRMTANSVVLARTLDPAGGPSIITLSASVGGLIKFNINAANGIYASAQLGIRYFIAGSAG